MIFLPLPRLLLREAGYNDLLESLHLKATLWKIPLRLSLEEECRHTRSLPNQGRNQVFSCSRLSVIVVRYVYVAMFPCYYVFSITFLEATFSEPRPLTTRVGKGFWCSYEESGWGFSVVCVGLRKVGFAFS